MNLSGRVMVKAFVFLWILGPGLLATTYAQLPGLHIKKAQGKIVVDGAAYQKVY